MRPPLLALLLATVLAAVPSPAGATAHQGMDNATTFPDPLESTQRGPLDDGPVSWFPTVLIVFAVGLGAILFVVANRWTRPRP